MFEVIAVVERAITGWQDLAICRTRASAAQRASQLVSKQPLIVYCGFVTCLPFPARIS